MRVGAQGILVGGAMFALVLPCAVATLLWLGTPLLLPSDPFQFAVFTLVFSRGLLYLGVPRLRKLSWGASIILFSGEFLMLPVAVVLSAVTGNLSEVAFASSYFASWFSASLLVYPPVAAYAIAVGFRERARLAFVLPAAACCFTTPTVIIVAIQSAGGSHGLTGVLSLVLSGLRRPFLPSGFASGLVAICGAILFASLFAYAVSGRSGASGKLAPQLSLAVAGAVGLLVWVLALPHLEPWLVLGIPTLVIVSAVWVSTHGS